MAKITVKELDAISRERIGEIVRDGGGLWGKVRANKNSKNGITVAFWFRYKKNKKSKDIACGSWPKDSMPTIRKKRDEAKILTSSGIDPAQERKVARKARQDEIARKLSEIQQQHADSLTFYDLFTSWLKDGVRRADGNAELIGGIQFGSIVAYARPLADAPYVRIYSILQRDVQQTPELMIRLNDLNADSNSVRLIWMGGAVIAASDIPVSPFVSPIVCRELSSFCQIADLVSDILQAEFEWDHDSADLKTNPIKH